MPQYDEATLARQIEADPRVQQLAQQTGFIGAAALRQLGYDVPETATYATGLNGRTRGFSLGDGFWGGVAKAIPIAAGTLVGYGGAAALGGGASGAGANASTPLGGALPGAADAPSLSSLLGTAPGGATAGVGNAAAAGAGTAAAKGFGGKLKDVFTDPNNLMDLGGVITALIGGSRGGGGGQASPDTQRLNQITEERMRRVDPLHQAVTQLAWGRLPTNARQGVAPPTYKPLP